MITTETAAERPERNPLVALDGGRAAKRRSTRWAPLMIRLAVADDRPALRELAYLDSRRPIADDTVLAERDGRIVAAVAVNDGTVIADPFLATADVVELLRIRAQQLSRELRTVA